VTALASSGTSANTLVAARCGALVADQMTAFLLPLVVFSLTGDASLSGLVFAAQSVPRVVAMPLLAVAGVRWNPRFGLIGSDVTRALAMIALGLWATPTVLIAAAPVLAVLSAHATLTMEWLLSKAVVNDAAALQSKQQASYQLAVVVGPLLIGGAALVMPVQQAMLLIAVVLALTAASTACAMPQGERSPRAASLGAKQYFSAVGRTFSTVAANQPLIVLMQMTLLVNIVGSLAVVALPAIVMGQFGTGEAAVAVTALSAAVFSLVGAVAAALCIRRRDAADLARLAFLLLIPGAAVMATADQMPVFAGALACWSAGIAIFSAWMRVRRLQLITTHTREQLALFVATIVAGAPVAGVLLYIFGQLLDPQPLLASTAAVAAVLLLRLSYVWRRHLHVTSA
jgi:MFS family permease